MYVIFIGYLKTRGERGLKANLPNPLCIRHCISKKILCDQILPLCPSKLSFVQGMCSPEIYDIVSQNFRRNKSSVHDCSKTNIFDNILLPHLRYAKNVIFLEKNDGRPRSTTISWSGRSGLIRYIVHEGRIYCEAQLSWDITISLTDTYLSHYIFLVQPLYMQASARELL